MIELIASIYEYPILVNGIRWGNLRVIRANGDSANQGVQICESITLINENGVDLMPKVMDAIREKRRSFVQRGAEADGSMIWVLLPFIVPEATERRQENEVRITGKKSELARPQKELHPRIQLALDFVQSHLDEPITIRSISRLIGISEQYFCRLFREEMQVSFVQYLTDQRLEKARSMLLDEARSIKEIAFNVGFGSVAQFSRVFRKAEGMSAGEYRESRRD
jgi:AraC-like DNA-binding protein